MSSAFDMSNSISESSNHLPYGPSNVSAITNLSEGPITEFSESTKPSKSARVTRKHSVTLATQSSERRSGGKAPLRRRGAAIATTPMRGVALLAVKPNAMATFFFNPDAPSDPLLEGPIFVSIISVSRFSV